MVAAVTVRQDGFAEMAYVGATPWHGLGQKLDEDASIEAWLELAGMDWKILRSKVRYFDQDKNMHEMPEQHVLFRSDNRVALGMVSPKYKIVQPAAVLEFFRDLTEANGFKLNTAGTLFDGRRFWALASVGEDACVVGEDKIGGFLLLSSSCDGTLATSARFTSVRVVCNNTLSMALSSSSKKEVSVNHRSQFDAEAVKGQLGIARGHFKEFLQATRQLAATPVTEMLASEFLDQLLMESKIAVVNSDGKRKSTQHQKIMSLFNGEGQGAQLEGARGTAWGLVNAVTEFVDHHARAKTPSHRLANAWFGRGDDLKTKAMEKALAMVA